MRRFTWVIVCSMVILSFSGCIKPVTDSINEYVTDTAENIAHDILLNIMSDLENYEDGSTIKRQELRVYPAGNNNEMRTIANNSIIAAYIQKTIMIYVESSVQLKSFYALPSDAEEIYIYELWQEDLDSDRPIDEKPLLKAYRSILYSNASGFYLLLETEDTFNLGHYYIALSDATGKYLVDLAESNLRFNNEENNREKAESEDDEDHTNAYYKLEGRTDIDYESIASVSKNQKIEVISAKNDNIAFSIVNLEDIVEFLQNQRAVEWVYINSIPADAQKVCDVVRYAEARRTVDKQLAEQYRDVLFVNSDGYYIETIIADNGMDASLDELEKLRFEIPDNVGDYLKGLCN